MDISEFYGANVDKIWKEITNPYAGLVLDNKIIPERSKGVVIKISYGDKYVGINWNINDEKVFTKISLDKFLKILEHKIIDYAENHIDIPRAKFEIGDLVETSWTSGIIKGREYRATDNQWWYDLITIEGLLSDDYEVKYTKERESDLSLVGIIGEEVQFKDNKYLITIKKVEEEVRCDE
jgi:hypothetical protein